MNWRIGLGAALIIVGGILALFFTDLEFFWFRGGPLGIILVIVGVLDLLDGVRRGRRPVRSDPGR
ncbi:hypothetical protein ACIGG9_01065 [Pseudonocardia alni]|uniref:hypothetical protein n=1 Tax=Pseudonocardia alni TaxID=33907 RepID=UPI0033EB30FD